MERTRYSLFYVIGYLLGGGTGMLLAPQFTLRLLFSHGSYDDVMVRFAGLLMLVLGLVILQIVRLRVERLYSTTVAVRLLILAGLSFFYLLTDDPLMIVLFGIVGLGVAGTLACLLADRSIGTI